MGESGRVKEICSPKGMRTVTFVTSPALRGGPDAACGVQMVGLDVIWNPDFPNSFFQVSL